MLDTNIQLSEINVKSLTNTPCDDELQISQIDTSVKKTDIQVSEIKNNENDLNSTPLGFTDFFAKFSLNFDKNVSAFKIDQPKASYDENKDRICCCMLFIPKTYKSLEIIRYTVIADIIISYIFSISIFGFYKFHFINISNFIAIFVVNVGIFIAALDMEMMRLRYLIGKTYINKAKRYFVIRNLLL